MAEQSEALPRILPYRTAAAVAMLIAAGPTLTAATAMVAVAAGVSVGKQ